MQKYLLYLLESGLVDELCYTERDREGGGGNASNNKHPKQTPIVCVCNFAVLLLLSFFAIFPQLITSSDLIYIFKLHLLLHPIEQFDSKKFANAIFFNK